MIVKDDITETVSKLLSKKASRTNYIPISIKKNLKYCYCENLSIILEDCLQENFKITFNKQIYVLKE